MPLESEVLARLAKLSDAVPQETAAQCNEILKGVAYKMQLAAERAETARLLASVPLFSRENKPCETARSFFDRAYAPIVSEHKLYADDLKKHDPRLYCALAAHERGRGLQALLPLRARTDTAGQRRITTGMTLKAGPI